MANDQIQLREFLGFLHPDLAVQIIEVADFQTVPQGTEILRAGQFVKVIPLVINGLLKVYTRFEDRELLLYYIQPKESCVMSFAAGMKNEPSQVYAITEEESELILLPSSKVQTWVKQYPELNNLFYQQYNLRYRDLLETINEVLFNKMDNRLLKYLKERVEITGKNPLKISHKQIASELGTAREVVSRVMKKLEKEGTVKQEYGEIKVLDV